MNPPATNKQYIRQCGPDVATWQPAEDFCVRLPYISASEGTQRAIEEGDNMEQVATGLQQLATLSAADHTITQGELHGMPVVCSCTAVQRMGWH